MRDQVIQHHDIARLQRGHQHLLDVRAKRGVVDGAIEDGRRGKRRGAERRHQRVRLPVATGGVVPNSRAAQAAGVATDQIGGHAGFVDEDILPRIVERLRLVPVPAGGRDIRASLFVGVDRFF